MPVFRTAGYVCLASAASATCKCPLCRQEHILDPEMLKARRDSFRSGYRAWRRGKANGARGEVSGVALAAASPGKNLQNKVGGKRSLADFIDVPQIPPLKGQGVSGGSVPLKKQRPAPTEDMSSIAEVLTMMKSAAAAAGPAGPGTFGRYQVKAKRRRKSTDAVKRQLTGIMHTLCNSELMPCVEGIEKSRLPQLGVPNPNGRFALVVKFGREPSLMKERISVGISAILNALDSQEREPLKWDTLQRDILWKYQRRIQSDSLYVYEESAGSDRRETIEQYGAEILKGLAPLTVDDVLREPLGLHAAAAKAMTAVPTSSAPAASTAASTSSPRSDAETEDDAVAAESSQQLPPSVTSGESAAPVAASTGKQSTILVCGVPGCGYSSIHQRYLDQHRRGHTGIKPFACNWPGCTYACSGKGHLVRHIRVHTGEKPYKCTFKGCGYAATQSGHLTAHIRKHEPGKTGSTAASSTAASTTGGSSPRPAASMVAVRWQPAANHNLISGDISGAGSDDSTSAAGAAAAAAPPAWPQATAALTFLPITVPPPPPPPPGELWMTSYGASSYDRSGSRLTAHGASYGASSYGAGSPSAAAAAAAAAAVGVTPDLMAVHQRNYLFGA